MTRTADGLRFFFLRNFFSFGFFLNFFLPRTRTPSGLLPSSQTVRAHPHYPRTLPLCHLLSLGGSRRIFLNFLFVCCWFSRLQASAYTRTPLPSAVTHAPIHVSYTFCQPVGALSTTQRPFCEKVFFCCSLVATVFCSLRTRDYASQLHTHQLRWNKPIPQCNTSGKAFRAALQSASFRLVQE